MPPAVSQVIRVNSDYRFVCEKFGRTDRDIWILQKKQRNKRTGEVQWRFIANSSCPVALGLYCEWRGIVPDADCADGLLALLENNTG